MIDETSTGTVLAGPSFRIRFKLHSPQMLQTMELHSGISPKYVPLRLLHILASHSSSQLQYTGRWGRLPEQTLDVAIAQRHIPAPTMGRRHDTAACKQHAPRLLTLSSEPLMHHQSRHRRTIIGQRKLSFAAEGVPAPEMILPRVWK